MGGRRRNPDARAAAGRVAPSGIPSIVFPTFKHFRRRYSPAADACTFSSPSRMLASPAVRAGSTLAALSG